MQPSFLTSICSMNVGELAETKPAATWGVNITIYLNRWTRRHNLKNLADLLVKFKVRYRTPVLRSCTKNKKKQKQKQNEIKTRCLLLAEYFVFCITTKIIGYNSNNTSDRNKPESHFGAEWHARLACPIFGEAAIKYQC